MSTAVLHVPPRDGDVPDPVREVKRVLAGMSTVRHAYQPIVSLRTGQVVGYEALARFGSGQRSPLGFFSAADELGRRTELEAHLLQLALTAVMPSGCFLAVNICPVLLTSDAIWSLLRAHGRLDGIVIELTEHSPVDHLPPLRRRVDQLRERGARIALDDVGAGWSGLAQMAALRPDIVKLDKSLVKGLADDEVKLALAELMAGFVDRIGSQLLAEGVEQPRELDALSELGMDLAQGWLLGRPQFRPGGLSSASELALAEAPVIVPARPSRTVGALQDTLVAQVRHPAAVGFLPGGLPRYAVVVDDVRRPVAVWVANPNPGSPSGWTHPVTCVTPATSLASALTVALARPDMTRHDPLVVLASDGSVTGMLPMDALLSASALLT